MDDDFPYPHQDDDRQNGVVSPTIWLNGLAYELETFSDPHEDGSIQATLVLKKGFVDVGVPF